MISIITPTHKKPHLLDLTIESVFCQSSSDWEWIVLDNSPEEYFERYLNDFLEKRVQYYHLRNKVKIFRKTFENINIGHLKNVCVSLTSCSLDEFVLLLDHDDFLHKCCVEEMIVMSNKYPDADYITGDLVKLNYENDTLFAYQLDKSNNLVSKDLKIDIGDTHINFGYIEDCIIRGMELDDNEWVKVYTDIDCPRRLMLQMHPRCIKKRLLTNEPFKFYEGHELSEDSVQQLFLGLFGRGCYIPQILYYNISYQDCSNASRMPVSDDCIERYREMMKSVITIREHFFKLFPDYDMNSRFINKF